MAETKLEPSDFSVPLHLRLGPSWQLATILAVIHGGAVCCLMVTSLPRWTLLLGMLVVLGHFLYALGQHALRLASTAITEFILSDDARIQLITRGGRRMPSRLVGGYSHPMLGVLRVRLGPWHRRALVLLPDMADPDRLRELRVRVRQLARSTDRSIAGTQR